MTTISTTRAEPTGEFNPRPHPDAVVLSATARFLVLTDGLIRMEWSPDGMFEDCASFAFVHRHLTPPAYSTRHDGEWLIIQTDALTLRYKEDGKPFSSKNLAVEVHTGGVKTKWHPGVADTGNLLGTFRTLDGISGDSDMETGILSRSGWSLIDDSERLLFDNSDWPWVKARRKVDSLDWYFFAFGTDYIKALQDFTKVAGRIPMPPKYVFGAWWSRYWAYTDQELKDLVGEFRAHKIPLDVLVVDMDWHLDGWTGYTWNPKYFPDPKGFLDWTETEGLKVPLNLHPADGVGKHEAAFGDMATALNLDPSKIDRIPFDCASREFMDAYFKLLHHPLERQGVDFWWTDWQQGTHSKVEGLDPLFWLNYLHFTEWDRDAGVKAERPFIFSRWGGLGNHRYPIGFSGDTFCDWPSLAFQPFFTSTAGNVGYDYWSHDIGGHQPGKVDPELYARWIQWGAFSPVLRTHTTKNPEAERRIWAFDEETFEVARDAWLLRYALIPYIYTAARNTYDTALPLCQPLYYQWPKVESAYHNTHEYLFGDQMLLAPVTTPRNPKNLCASWNVWLPPGEWTNWYTGDTYEGPQDLRLLVPLDEIPIFVKEGGIIPTAPPMKNTHEKPLDVITWHVFPGQAGSYTLYQDAGDTKGYLRNEFARTPISFQRNGDTIDLRIDAAEGSYPGMVKARGHIIRFSDMLPPKAARLSGKDVPELPAEPRNENGSAGWFYNSETFTLAVRTPKAPVDQKVSLSVTMQADPEKEALLRQGLRGYYRMVRDLADAYGSQVPAPVTDMLDRIRRVADAGDMSPADVQAIRDKALLLADVVEESTLAEPQRTHFLTRLLGLFSRLDVHAERQSGSLAAIAEVSIRPPLGGQHDAGIDVEFNPPGAWKTKAVERRTAGTAGVDEVVTLEAKFTGQQVPQTATMSAVVKVDKDNRHIELPVSRDMLPSINAWWVVGPFDAKYPGIDRVFPPEESIDLDATYVGKRKDEPADEGVAKTGKSTANGQPIEWRRVVRKIEPGSDLSVEFFVNFSDVFGRRYYNAVAYALTYLEVPRDMDAQLAVGSDDGLAIWVNDQKVHRHQVGRVYLSRQDIVPIRLRKGKNKILLKIDQGGGDWGFCAHVEDRNGKMLPDVQATLEP